MLTEAEFVEQQRALGRRIHEHDGVFWEQAYPGYSRPAFVYKPFNRGAARPAWPHRLLGYSHQVPCADQANRRLPVMAMDRTELDGFTLMSLPQKKRNQVRRALKHCEFRRLDELEPWLERMRAINISQSERQAQGAGAPVAAGRYIHEAEAWRAQIRREFALAKREWWGAFAEGELVAYLRSYQVESVRLIQQIKTHSDAYAHNAVDGLNFTLLERAAADPSCRQILYGEAMHPSLNRFKEQFLFRVVELPYYSSNARLMSLARKCLRR